MTQLAFYAYCIATLFALLWALKVVKAVSPVLPWVLHPSDECVQESTNSTLLVAHLYILDHFIQSLFHYLFYYDYWYNQPHDGRRPVNSRAQQDLINLAVSRGEIIDPATQTSQGIEDLRAALAGEIWESESKFASWTIVVGFFFKVSGKTFRLDLSAHAEAQLYCALVLYSYAAHLRSSTYHALPMTAKPKTTQSALPQAPALRAEVENFSAPETSATRPDRSRRTVDYVENEEDFHWEE